VQREPARGTALGVRRRLRVSAAYEPGFHRSASAYEVLGASILGSTEGWSDWPDVSAYDAYNGDLVRRAGRALSFRDVAKADVMAKGGYDRYIRETGLIPTRSRNWHDFFNAGIWARFPRAKLALHGAMLSEFERRGDERRTRRQDWLTHFDECGVLVISDRLDLLGDIAALRWRSLFVDRRDAFNRHARVICFGHATLEALREPYVGLMGKALLCHGPALGGRATGDSELGPADAWLAAQLSAVDLPPLRALPVLGVPGWHAANRDPAFYDRARYFRDAPAGPAAPPHGQPQ
jgi:DUF3025 family protein